MNINGFDVVCATIQNNASTCLMLFLFPETHSTMIISQCIDICCLILFPASIKIPVWILKYRFIFRAFVKSTKVGWIEQEEIECHGLPIVQTFLPGKSSSLLPGYCYFMQFPVFLLRL